MRKIPVEEVKKIQLEMLRYFADFCDAHHLTYYLAYGTLIGAVRHHGYIPWDDDIDTHMPRQDYDKLVALCAEISVKPYTLNTVETNPNFLSLSSKLTRTDTVVLPSRFVSGYVYGVSIDIFPLDTVGNTDNEEQAQREYVRSRAAHEKTVSRYHHYMGNISPKSLRGIGKKIAYRFAELRYGALSERMRNYARMLADNKPEECNFYVNLTGLFLYRKEWFQNRVKLDFESAQFWAPADYDAVLRKQYGNYMEYPPESERVQPHTFTAYYLDD